MLPDVIETERLRLRPFRLQDVEDVLSYASDPEWGRFLPVPQPYTEEDTEKFVAGQLLLDGKHHRAWAIELNGTVIGDINISFDFPNRVAEIGYSISRTYWGRGYGTEAAGAVVDTAFSVHVELNKVRALADPRNPGSLRVMEKIGMVREGILRQNRVFRGELVDEVCCGILRSEWEGKQ